MPDGVRRPVGAKKSIKFLFLPLKSCPLAVKYCHYENDAEHYEQFWLVALAVIRRGWLFRIVATDWNLWRIEVTFSPLFL